MSVFLSMNTVKSTRGNGNKISLMAKADRFGTTGAVMKDSTKKVLGSATGYII